MSKLVTAKSIVKERSYDMDDTYRTDAETIAEFETKMPEPLPESYKEFLIFWDGEKLDDRFFRTNYDRNKTWKIWELSKLYSTKRAAGDSSLQENCDPAKFHDMGNYRQIVSDFIAIGEEVSGGVLLLNLKSEEIWLLINGFPVEDETLRIGESSSFLRVAHDFRQFRRLLLSEDDNNDNNTFGDYWYETAESRRIKNDKIQEKYQKMEMKEP
ncbi:SMI1/KNR4 family protein [Tateyamaria sp.]|uniref:SMI1/KNR4 family protein n=1 Tax=Tateyamaria sp. TaxID=1929288 RepID=UPI00329D2907